MSFLSLIGLDPASNYSLYTVPAAFALAFVPHVYSAAVGGKHFDPANPRKLQTNITNDTSLDKVIKARIFRAKAAEQNAYESISLFAPAVVAANLARLDAATLNGLTFGYLVFRVMYLVIYIRLQDNRRFALVRSAAWFGSAALTMALWIKAASGLR